MTDDAERTCAGMNLHGKDIKIFAGNSNKPLAAAMAECLGITLGRSEVGRFSDGEIQVSIQESVRGSDVYVVQSTSSPVNRNLMELLIMMDAFRRASAGRITAVIPYYGYARQDRKSRARDPITAKLVADLIVTAGADHGPARVADPGLFRRTGGPYVRRAHSDALFRTQNGALP